MIYQLSSGTGVSDVVGVSLSGDNAGFPEPVVLFFGYDHALGLPRAADEEPAPLTSREALEVGLLALRSWSNVLLSLSDRGKLADGLFLSDAQRVKQDIEGTVKNLLRALEACTLLEVRSVDISARSTVGNPWCTVDSVSIDVRLP